ncbi:MAG: GspH/FimT family protein [Firmicutes bacterium]|nr:GspH/FimT family protein [Bacillota bacterium]
MNRNTRTKGFSYIEVTIVIAIAAIMLAIGIPFFLKGRANAKVRTSANEFKAALDLARSEAKSTGADITVEFIGSLTSSTGYNLKEASGRVLKTDSFTGSEFIDASGLTGTSPLKFSSNGTTSQEGSILVKSGNTDKYFSITIVKTTGLVKIEEKN